MTVTKEEVLDIVRHIAVLNSNPALGGGGIGNHKTSELLHAFVDLIDGEGDTEEDLIEFAREVKALLDRHGDAERGQWSRIREKIEKVRAKVKAIRERIKELRAKRDEEDRLAKAADEEAARLAAEEEARKKAASTPVT